MVLELIVLCKGEDLRYLFDAATGQLLCLNPSLSLFGFEETSLSWKTVTPPGRNRK